MICALPLKADVEADFAEVRFVPGSNIGRFYSTTSSAAASNSGGRVMPSAVAVFRLMKSRVPM
jgi:hypothetical protein